MNILNEEYELFKSICQLKSVAVKHNDMPLINNLQNKGLKIIQTEQGFKLDEQIHILSESKIRSGLDPEINGLIEQLNIIFETRSTNKAISNTVQQGRSYTVLLSEYQSNGQGRRGKKWISPLGYNIYASIQFQSSITENSQFIPLITAISVCKALEKTGIHGCKIKWPNDIYINEKKVGGILVESRYNAQKAQIFVVGIGLNVNMQVNDQIDQTWTSLRKSQNRVYDRNIVLSALLSETMSHYNQLSNFEINHFKQDWQSMDLLHGQAILVTDEKSTYEAIAHGIGDDGALIVERSYVCKNVRQKIYSAEVSVKPAANRLCDTKEGQQ